MFYRCNIEGEKNDVVTVTNNNVEYFEELAKHHSEDCLKFTNKVEEILNKAKDCLTSCKEIRNLLQESTIEILDAHSTNEDNPHNVTYEQIGTYSASQVDELLSSELAKKNPSLVAGQNVSIIDNEDGTQTIIAESTIEPDYSLNINKPSINEVTLLGNKSSHELGLASIDDIPTKISELQNDEGYLTEHQDITGKQDVLSAGDGISIENNVVATLNRADSDLSNLSSVGKKVIDGQWIASELNLSTATAVGTYTIDMSNYLPQDNFSYEVLMNLYLHSTSTDGSAAYLHSSFYDATIFLARSANGSGTKNVNTFSIIIPLDRIFQYEISVKAAASGTYLKALAYRRIGTNS